MALAGAAILMPSTSRAALMAYEGFNYPTGSGNLTGQAGGFGWNGAWQTVVTSASSVTSGSLTAGVNAPSGYDSHSVGNAAFTPNGTREGRFLDTSAGGSFGQAGYIGRGGNIGAPGKTIYISFMQQPSVANNNYYEFELHRGDLNDPGRVGGVGCDTSGSTNVYLRTPSAAQTVIGPASTAVSFYVVRIDFAADSNDTVTVYQDPTSATEAGATPSLVESGAGDMSFNGISFGAFVGSTTVTHDEVRVGTSWTDVVSPGAYSTGKWVGGGGNNAWSTGGNWDNGVVPVFATSVTFTGSAGLNNTNDLTGISANNITFDSAAGAFTLNGNSLGLNPFANITFSASPAAPVTQTINLPLVTAGDITIGTRTNGNITINGNITGGNQVTQAGPDNAGILTLAGTNSLKGMVVNNGTNIITGTTTINGIGGSSFFYVPDAGSGRNATLIIQNGATLTVTNGFQDAAVIARDGAHGRIIQNGGTFNFAINDGSHNYLFVGASGQPNASAEYDMNGGVLDMNGDTLGIGLGVNSPAGSDITGVVNQSGGVITNVLNLSLSPLIANGNGIYNLTGGSIYIESGGITAYAGGAYQLNLGGGTIGAEASWSSSLDMNLTGSNGPVTFNPAGNTIALSGVLSGIGGLTVNGAGVLELSGANTYSGDTTVTTGSTLQFDTTGSSAGVLRLASGSTLILNFTGTFAAGGLYTNGVALPVGSYNSSNLPGFISGSGTLNVTSGISTGHWTGGGTDNNWSTAGNWDNNAVPIFPHSLVFAGNTRLTNNNDLAGITVNGLTFDSNAGPFELTGNDITLGDGLGFNGNPPAPVTQTVNLNMAWNADKTLDTPTNGNLSLGGNITATTNQLTKADAGTLTLGGVDSFAGYIINGGTNIITGSTTVSGTGSSVFYLGNANANYDGTLIIQPGAALNVSGTLGDALVIGRDAGSGTVIQNGGTFTYSCNETFLYVGATSHSGTHAEYDMNGGVLDMGGVSLGVALGDAGVSYTAALNQTGGAINNVFALDLGATRAYGHGVYNLTGGSITIDFGGIISDSGSYALNLGGGTIGASSSWSSALNMTLTGTNGPVTFDTMGNTITLSGNLSGPGGLIVVGGGILELSGANNYTGDTTVSAGTLQLDTTSSSPGAFRLANGTSLLLNFSGTHQVGGLYTNGVALPSGVYNSSNLPGFISGSGSVQVTSVSSGLWTGLGADNNWNTAGNWNNNAVPVFPIGLTFAGNTGLANNNNLTNLTINSITFDSAAGPFVIGGNDIALAGSIDFNGNPAAPVTQTVNLNMAWSADKTVSLPANGNLTLGGNIASGNNVATAGAGTLTFGGANTFENLDVNGGTTIITGDTTVNGNGVGYDRIYVADGDSVANCNATLVIQPGATFNVTGNFNDAMVIGRDSGVGAIVQNGGTFSFNPGNQSYIFVGASGSTATRAEYDMNGGVLDMNGKTFGIALGANAVITGVLNQVSGVITNVGNLFFDPFFTQGYGIYNLTGGSMYIGAGGITVQSGGGYQMNLGGGTIAAQASWASSLNMNLTGNNGSVTFNPAGNTITLSGILSGTGGLAVAGGGTLELSGANAYTGDTTVNGGSTLKLDSTSNSSGIFRLATGATLNLNYSGTITVSACYTNGVALASGVYTSANLPGFITGAGSLTISAPAAPVINKSVVSGGNLILMGGGGTAGAGYVWLSSTNLALPVASWTTNTTGNFDGSGNFSNAIPVSVSTPARFFRLRTP